jgi:hypothetical protein
MDGRRALLAYGEYSTDETEQALPLPVSDVTQ